jgi:hypothetical protein
MLRLTTRSGKDGRFLARVIDPGNGFPFVLDFGDKRIIDDAQQRLLHGFTMWRYGELVTAVPQAPDMVPLLAEFYIGEGLLVALEEPTWSGRDHTLDERIPVPEIDLDLMAPPHQPPRLSIVQMPSDLDEADVPTEVVALDDLTDLGEVLETTEETESKRRRS